MALASPTPQTLVVFGASGDLARRKLLPALYDLAYEGLMPDRYAIVGSGGSPLDDAGFRERARGGVEEFSRHRLDEGRWEAFARGLSYVRAPLDDPAAFDASIEAIACPASRMRSAGMNPSVAPAARAVLDVHARFRGWALRPSARARSRAGAGSYGARCHVAVRA
jgi:glucose-6-phosphate 1-dehydrogenase